MSAFERWWDEESGPAADYSSCKEAFESAWVEAWNAALDHAAKIARSIHSDEYGNGQICHVIASIEKEKV